jgi:hypothetical protein
MEILFKKEPDVVWDISDISVLKNGNKNGKRWKQSDETETRGHLSTPSGQIKIKINKMLFFFCFFGPAAARLDDDIKSQVVTTAAGDL